MLTIIVPSVHESYITHVRITEDSAYPSAPAPPDSAPGNKKPRVIIVSVRRSGRVRMHKARENNDGTFSIGKTWMLDDLSAIQSYGAFVPKTPVEQQHKDWATNVGFVVTVGKPYYWHARSAKEKEFFIGSLVKIYKKYTGGKVPNLIGFDERERQMLAGAGGPTAPSATPPARPSPEVSAPAVPPVPAAASQPPSAYGSRDPSRDGHREIRRKPSEDPALRAQKSRDHMSRPSTGSKPAPSPFGSSSNLPAALQPAQKPKEPPTTFLSTADDSILSASQEDVRSTPPRGEEPAHHHQPPPAPIAAHSVEAKVPVPKRSNDALRPTTPGSHSGEVRGVAASPASSVGRKSPHHGQQRPSQDTGTRDVPPPAAPFNEPKQVPAPEPDRSSPPLAVEPEVAAAVAAVDEPALKAPVEQKEPAPVKLPAAAEPPAPIAAPAPVKPPAPIEPPTPVEPPTPAEPPAPAEPHAVQPEPTEEEADEADEAEDHRPGLGPMVKKKSTKEIAGAFRKAANAYGAFKPRPGGAGERLMAAAKKQKAEGVEPDGITSVVPAPSLNRPANEAPKSPVDEPADRAAAATPPTFEITKPVAEEVPIAPTPPVVPSVAPSPDPEKALSTPERSQESLADVAKMEDRSRTPSPAAQGRRRRRREDHTIKYCQALGIDPSALDGRGIEFDEILTELGWNGRLGDEQKIEDLEADVRREIGRVEATSWLGNLEQQEGKVEQLAVLIDKTIEECEELDGLLTLYSHELNVSLPTITYPGPKRDLLTI